MTKPKLQPCPFCGSPNVYLSCYYDSDDNRPHAYQHYGLCSQCASRGSEFYAVDEKKKRDIAQQEAMNAWNRRTQ